MKKHRFNELKPPKPIHVIAACVLELVDDAETPALCAERFIDGADRFGRGFVKHNNNSGFVDHDEHRSTPQAFSSAQINFLALLDANPELRTGIQRLLVLRL